MKAIVLYQPWASAMAVNLKRNETRPRPWNYAGDVAICAGKRLMDSQDILLAQTYQVFWSGGPEYGVVLCVVRMIECLRSESFKDENSLSETERAFGNYSPGRFVYATTDLRRLKTPVPVIGRQGVFNLPPDVEQKVLTQL